MSAAHGLPTLRHRARERSARRLAARDGGADVLVHDVVKSFEEPHLTSTHAMIDPVEIAISAPSHSSAVIVSANRAERRKGEPRTPGLRPGRAERQIAASRHSLYGAGHELPTHCALIELLELDREESLRFLGT